MTPEALEMSKKYAARVLELEKEVAELREEIHERSNKAMRMIGEITKERDRAYQGSEAQTQDQLAAAQATNKKLAGYLWKFGRHFEDCGWQMNKPCNCGFEAANSTANDTTALDARLAAERERCAKVCGDFGADAIRSMT